MSLIALIFTICALRTNICLFTAILTILIAFPLAAGSFWAQAEGHRDHAKTLLTVSFYPLLIPHQCLHSWRENRIERKETIC
jgi:hypothetical protein